MPTIMINNQAHNGLNANNHDKYRAHNGLNANNHDKYHAHNSLNANNHDKYHASNPNTCPISAGITENFYGH